MKKNVSVKDKYKVIRNELVEKTLMRYVKIASLENFRELCMDEIIVLLGYINDKPIYKCLLCDKQINDVDLDNSIVINASNYCINNFNINNENDFQNKFYLIKNNFFKVAMSNSDLTNNELATMINQSLNGYSYVKKAANQ